LAAWPPHRRPDAPGVARFAAVRAGRVRFHQWLQWLLDVQLARAAAELPLVHDLPVGVDPAGADAWAWQDARRTCSGRPRRLQSHGQNWVLPHVFFRLRAAAYELLVRTIRPSRHAAARIDHVMGLFRLF
jgi:4-alpha-glucanotransferase